MNLEDTKKLINNVIENEFNHIQEIQEYGDTLKNAELNARNENAADIFQRLIEFAPEHKELLDDWDSAVASYWLEACRYYFKKGVMAGATNLKFLEDTKIMEYI